MKTTIAVLVFSFACMAQPDYASAIEKIRPYLESFASIAESRQLDPSQVLAIGFPETMRYWALRDNIEVGANAQLYVRGGRQWSNFSIGMFQMKPSWAEDLESEILASAKLKRQFAHLAVFSDTLSANEIRQLRLDRLSDPEIAFDYLCAFTAYLDIRFYGWDGLSDRQHTMLYATAYNYGFHHGDRDLFEFMDIPAFSYGRHFAEPMPYGEISWMFKSEHAHELF